MMPGRGHAGPKIVPATQKRVDRLLAETLQERSESVTSVGESQLSLGTVFIEICAWIAAAALVWCVVGYSV
jgi:hypothetical protein